MTSPYIWKEYTVESLKLIDLGQLFMSCQLIIDLITLICFYKLFNK